MSTIDERLEVKAQVEDLRTKAITDFEHQGNVDSVHCPLCHGTLLSGMDYEIMDRIKDWTIGQLIAFVRLVEDSGLDLHDTLKRTNGNKHDHVGVPFHGMYVGIEPDGYTHS